MPTLRQNYCRQLEEMVSLEIWETFNVKLVNGDGVIQVCEAENIGSRLVDKSNILSMEGLLSFRNFKNLSCRDNGITNLDVSSLKRLQSVYCDNNNLSSLYVQGLTILKFLCCSNNQLTSLY